MIDCPTDVLLFISGVNRSDDCNHLKYRFQAAFSTALLGTIYEANLVFLHLSEQYFTSPHTFSHFFRQLNGRLHPAQIFVGKCCLLPLNDFTSSSTKKETFCWIIADSQNVSVHPFCGCNTAFYFRDNLRHRHCCCKVLPAGYQNH